MTYAEMLAGRGLKVGDQVVCEYRMPTPHQWWIHPFWVGVIEDAGTDKAAWNGSNTEAQFCVTVKSVRVRYLAGPDQAIGSFTQHDSLGNIRKLEFGDVKISPWFESTPKGRYELYKFAVKTGYGDRYGYRRLMVA